jgi:dihydropyrimidinase
MPGSSEATVTTAICGGTIVTPAGSFVGDVLIEGEVIAAVGRGLGAGAAEVLDATGCFVLPGCVDTHTHLEAIPGESREEDSPLACDDYQSGTRAAAVGGTTTVVDFAVQSPGVGLAETLEVWQQRLRDWPPAVDIGLHMIVTDMGVEGAAEEFDVLCERGVTSFKVFMALRGTPYWVDDGTLFLAAQAAAAAGGLLMVHAESGYAIEILQTQALRDGRTAAIHHALTRPPLTETEAVGHAVALCQLAGCPVYFMHVSCRDAVDALARAQSGGLEVYGETCPQYLAFTEDVLRQSPSEAAKYVFTPPPRPPGQRDAVWTGLRTGVLDVVSTDHCPYTMAQKARATSFLEIPNGAPGIENRLEVMYELGVREGRLRLERLVELLAATPARLFGLHPQKGSLNPGGDADVVIFNPERPRTIAAKDQLSRSDYSIYEGMEVSGSVQDVLFRGRLIVRDGRLVGADDRGRFIPRARWRGQAGARHRDAVSVSG